MKRKPRKKLSKADSGQGLLEYALIIAGIAVVLLLGFSLLRPTIEQIPNEPVETPIITPEPTDPNMVEVNVHPGDYIIIASGAGSYHVGQPVHCTATLEPGTKLVGWYDQNGKLISTSEDFTFTVWEDKDLYIKATDE